jgi:hypothetical protein
VRDKQQLPCFRAPNDIVSYTIEELLGIATQYAINKKAVRPQPIPGSREAVPGNSQAAPFGTAIQGAKKDAKGGKKRRKWWPQWVAATTDYDDDDDKKADGSNMEYVAATGHSVKRQARPPINHFERLLEEAYPNHAYPVKHKLKDCDMMENFMTLRSLTQDKESDEESCGRGVTLFSGEDAVMMIYEGYPPPRRHRMSNLSLETPTRCGQGPRNIGM